MNKKLSAITPLLMALLLTAGCASIVSGGPKSLPILSRPDNAECEIVDMRSGITIMKTRTPSTVTLANDAGYFKSASYKVKISKDGFIPREVEINSGLNGWYLGNIVFGGLIGILIVDPATGAMWKIHEDAISVDLLPDTPEGRQSSLEDAIRQEKAENKNNDNLVRMGQ